MNSSNSEVSRNDSLRRSQKRPTTEANETNIETYYRSKWDLLAHLTHTARGHGLAAFAQHIENTLIESTFYIALALKSGGGGRRGEKFWKRAIYVTLYSKYSMALTFSEVLHKNEDDRVGALDLHAVIATLSRLGVWVYNRKRCDNDRGGGGEGGGGGHGMMR